MKSTKNNLLNHEPLNHYGQQVAIACLCHPPATSQNKPAIKLLCFCWSLTRLEENKWDSFIPTIFWAKDGRMESKHGKN